MSTSAEELRAVLTTYREVKNASWPDLHPGMAQRAPRWTFASEADLRAELDGYLAEASAPTCAVRVFWKLGPKFIFDFSPKLPWAAQAAKYRSDDKEVFDSGKANLDILERQTSGSGAVQWVRVGKAPIKAAGDRVIGILGMYELIDEKNAKKLFFERSRRGGPGAV